MADAVMPVSVVVERRASTHPWQDYTWRPIGILPRTDAAAGKLLASGEGWDHFHCGSLDLELFRGETEGYLTNLSQDSPVIYVVLRRNEESDGLDYRLFLVTACPYEAMGYTAGDETIVEGVPMPPEVMAWVKEFVALHHVDVPFKKRKNKRHQADERGRGPRSAREEEVW
jgi:hypothetical protein